jgi:hypothetical protein
MRRVVLSTFVLTALFPTWAVATPPDLFEEYGDGGRHFEKIEIGHMLVYFHQRTIGGATVEKDYIVYQLDKDTGELLARKSHWRDDLPAVLPEVRISREQAEAMVGGEIQFSSLYIISPESDVFPFNPTPDNPCWAVRSIGNHGEYVVTVIDSVSGVILGNGVPPPHTAFSLTGPWYFEPCVGAWTSWSQNAEWWFNAMGYSTEEIEWPTEAKVQSHIQSDETAMFYELAHGGSTSFASGCSSGNYPEYTSAGEIEAWMVGYEKMPFTFVGSCAGMCSTGNGTFAYEFRKGSSENTTVVGYCGMSEPQCEVCWGYSLDWQDALFEYMSLEYAVKDAFDLANADYPVCSSQNCMRFAGDEDFAVVPPVLRAMCGNGTCDPGEDCDTCPADCGCSDGVYCNGEEYCSNGDCYNGEAPCQDPCEECNESSDTCDLIGACCYADGTCTDSREDLCWIEGGLYYGDCVLCDDPLDPPCVPADTEVYFEPNTFQAPAGGSVPLYVMIGDVTDLMAYQVVIEIARITGSGQLTIDCTGCPEEPTCGVRIDTDRPDYVFYDRAVFALVNCLLRRIGSTLSDAPGATVETGYLGEYTLDISPDATQGAVFEVSIATAPGLTYLRDPNSLPIRWLAGPVATVTVFDPVACTEPVVVPDGGRYLVVEPTGTASQALLVTGDAGDPDVSCVSLYVQEDGTLGSTPVFQTPAEWGSAVPVHGLEIIPGTTYQVQADCGSPGEPELSTPASGATWLWGDIEVDIVTGEPNNIVNIGDVLASVQAFTGDYSQTTLERVDLEPCEPDYFMNIGDVLWAVNAFTGQTFEEQNCPPPCPP